MSLGLTLYFDAFYSGIFGCLTTFAALWGAISTKARVARARARIVYQYAKLKYPKYRDDNAALRFMSPLIDRAFGLDPAMLRLNRPRCAKESITIISAYAQRCDGHIPDDIVTKGCSYSDHPPPDRGYMLSDVTDYIKGQWETLSGGDAVTLQSPVSHGFLEVTYVGHADPARDVPARKYCAVYAVPDSNMKFPPRGASAKPEGRVVEAICCTEIATDEVARLAGPRCDFNSSNRAALRWSLQRQLKNPPKVFLTSVEHSDWTRTFF